MNTAASAVVKGVTSERAVMLRSSTEIVALMVWNNDLVQVIGDTTDSGSKAVISTDDEYSVIDSSNSVVDQLVAS